MIDLQLWMGAEGVPASQEGGPAPTRLNIKNVTCKEQLEITDMHPPQH